MASALRSLLATVLCAGLGLAVAPCGESTHDLATLTTPAPAACVAMRFRWSFDVPDFVAPDPIGAPARPTVAIVASPRATAPAPATALDVLDVAPKTSPPT